MKTHIDYVGWFFGIAFLIFIYFLFKWIFKARKMNDENKDIYRKTNQESRRMREMNELNNQDYEDFSEL